MLKELIKNDNKNIHILKVDINSKILEYLFIKALLNKFLKL